MSKNPAVFDERKLRHINGAHLRELGLDELTGRLEAFTGRTGLRGAVEISREKIQTLADFWPLVAFLFDGPVDDPAAFEKAIGADGGAETLRAARAALAARRAVRRRARSRRRCAASSSSAGSSRARCSSRCGSRSPGTTVSPGIFETVALLGRDETLARIDASADRAERRKRLTALSKRSSKPTSQTSADR